LRENFTVDFDLMGRKLGKVLEYADSIRARYVIIVGPREIAQNMVSVRNMKTKEQKVVDVGELCKL